MTRRMWFDDALRSGVLLGIGVVLIAVLPDVSNGWGGHGPPPPAPEAWQMLLLLLAGGVGTVLRRARPLLGLLVVVGASILSAAWLGVVHTSLTLVFGEALYNVVLYSARRVSTTITVVTGVVVAALALLSLIGSGTREAVLSLLGLSLLLIPVAWAREVRHHQEAAAAADHRVTQARRMAELDQAAAIAAERARMARDLHDVVAGQLSAIAIQTEAARTLPDADPATLRRLLESVRGSSVSALAEMRTMIGLLRADDPGEPRTAPAGLDQLAALLAAGEASGLDIALDDRRPPDRPLPAAVDLAAYRIVQEALTNAAKHAPGSAVSLRLARADGSLTVELSNPLGSGEVRTADAGGTGTGLLGLRERAAAVGGALRAGPADGNWMVYADLPVPEPVPEPAR